MGQRQGERTSRSNTMSDAIGHHDTTTAEHAHHEELGWIRKYVFSTDHKVIGIQYGITSLLFLLFGFCLIMLLRWQVAYPGQQLPIAWLAKLLGETRMPTGIMLPEFYN